MSGETEMGRRDKTLKIGFPPPGSPLLDLRVFPADLLTGVLLTLRAMSVELEVPLHPDVAKAVNALEGRIE